MAEPGWLCLAELPWLRLAELRGREGSSRVAPLGRTASGSDTPNHNTWGVNRALDWGCIVVLLVEKDRLNRQDTDTLDDFRVELDFDAIFVESYRPAIPSELGGQDESP